MICVDVGDRKRAQMGKCKYRKGEYPLLSHQVQSEPH